MDISKLNELRLGTVGPEIRTGTQGSRTQPAPSGSFADMLQQAQSGSSTALKFSAHAQTRLQSRNIAFGPVEMKRIEGAVQKAAVKGSRESLVMMDESAFLVSVQNRTVITVVDKDHLKENVFTNIDSAVFA